jgi:hypothetical protein
MPMNIQMTANQKKKITIDHKKLPKFQSSTGVPPFVFDSARSSFVRPVAAASSVPGDAAAAAHPVARCVAAMARSLLHQLFQASRPGELTLHG